MAMTAVEDAPSYLKLTRRWTPLEYHPAQCRLEESTARFKIVPAGRRSGKTEIAKRHLVLSLWKMRSNLRPWDDPRFFAAAPTRDQAKRIWWQDLKKLTPHAWVKDISESDLRIRTKWGAELWVVGLDKAERIEGTPWDGGVIDELANCKPGIWDANIRPALADRTGWAWLIGVPDFDSPGQVDYARMHEVAKSGQDPEWEAFGWPSSDILPAAEVESARRRMDPLLFQQEFGGEFLKPSGLAFPSFDRKTHVRPCPYDPSLPLCWSLDFNVDPFCTGVIQHNKGDVRVIGEILVRDSSTMVMCAAFLERCEREKWNPKGVHIYGDATGKARDTTSGVSDWMIVRNLLKNHDPVWKYPANSWSIKDTLNSTRAKLSNAAGDVGLHVDTECRQLVDDFESLLWPSDLSDGHCVAWLRYFLQWEYPVRTASTGRAEVIFAGGN